jgi:predicted nucleic acid-binding protein
MEYLFDANATGDLMREHPEIKRRLFSLPTEHRAITCPIVKGEVLYGIARLPDGKRKANLEERAHAVFTGLPCVSVPDSAANFYSQIRFARERRGLSIAANDLWIAATALALGAVLVSRDSDMQGIEGLSVEDWTTATST